ncbi:LysR substrate-binding domain-containing protein [Alphaproteobacteria bacterium]|jgi:DNA-binding transcriptional LysR family regulator|nr:LysR substrate-binding domain-containing protein [Alphaproteobacteria bacterium]
MTIRFSLRQLEYMVAVGEAGSVVSASQKVNVSSSSISAAITQLETELGVQLFVRQHAQGLYLTAGGQRIFNEAKRILHSASMLSDLANDIVDTVRGPIVVGCFVTLAPLVSAAFRRSFSAENPAVDITIREGNQVELLAMLARAEIDIALTYDLEIPTNYDFEGLIDLPPQIILAADHPLQNKAEVTLEDLVDEPMVLLDMPLSRDYFLSLFHEHGLRPLIGERAANLASVRSLVANGFGYGLLNARTKTNLSPDGETLLFCPLAGAHRPMVFGLATIKTAHSPRVVTAFADHVRARVTTTGLPGLN